MQSGKMLFGVCDGPSCGYTMRYFVGFDEQGKLKYMCGNCNHNTQILDISVIRKLIRHKPGKGGDQVGV